MDRANINAIVLKDGTANWDIMKDTTKPDSYFSSEAEDTFDLHDMKILLKEGCHVMNSSIVIY